MKLFSILFYTVTLIVGTTLATVGLECTAIGDECLSSECCGIAKFNSAQYNSETYTPLITGKDKQICNVNSATTWSKTDSYGVTTIYTWSCGGASGAQLIKAASMLALATSIAVTF